jgi:hypothetical protein
MWIGDREVRTIRERVQVGFNTADVGALEAEDVLDKDGHFSPMLSRSARKHKPEYAHERSLGHASARPLIARWDNAAVICLRDRSRDLRQRVSVERGVECTQVDPQGRRQCEPATTGCDRVAAE